MNNLRDDTLRAVAAKRQEETVKRLGAMRAEALHVFCETRQNAVVVSLDEERQRHGNQG